MLYFMHRPMILQRWVFRVGCGYLWLSSWPTSRWERDTDPLRQHSQSKSHCFMLLHLLINQILAHHNAGHIIWSVVRIFSRLYRQYISVIKTLSPLGNNHISYLQDLWLPQCCKIFPKSYRSNTSFSFTDEIWSSETIQGVGTSSLLILWRTSCRRCHVLFSPPVLSSLGRWCCPAQCCL